MRASSGWMGCAPSCASRAVSMALAYRSPTFCFTLPRGALARPASSRMRCSSWSLRSTSSVPVLQELRSAGMVLRDSQPPLAYW